MRQTEINDSEVNSAVSTADTKTTTDSDTTTDGDTTAPTASQFHLLTIPHIFLPLKISITFNEAIDTNSITTNTSNTSCTGSLQISSDNFSSCVQMSASQKIIIK